MKVHLRGMCRRDEGLGGHHVCQGRRYLGERTKIKLTATVCDCQTFKINNIVQDYVVAQYCPMLDDDEQDFCVEWYGDAYIWMLVSIIFVDMFSEFILNSIECHRPPLLHGRGSAHLPDDGRL